MKKIHKIFLIILSSIILYYISLSIIPRFPIFDVWKAKSSYFGNGEITQTCFLIFSVLIILIFRKGNFVEFGFKSTSLKEILRPVPIAIGVAFLTLFLNMLTMIGSSTPPETGSFMDKNLLETIITVWIIASICEEIFWRGLVLSFLIPLSKSGIWIFKKFFSVPVIITGLLFGLGHFCLLGSMPDRVVINIVISASILGLIAGYFREKTGSLLPAITTHATFNIVGTLIPFLLMSMMAE